jgi:dolichol-phosphate mannosyltransferase
MTETVSGIRQDEQRLISIVVPVFDEEENIPALMERFDEIKTANSIVDFEFLVVDDGSSDRTFALLTDAARSRSDLSVVALSRNFGSHYAITAGLAHAAGEAMIVISGDLQEPLHLIEEFLNRWSKGYEVVWGIRERRVERSRGARLASAAFTKLLTRFSDIPNYPPQGPSGFLCTKGVARALQQFPERNRNVAGLVAWLGFEQTTFMYQGEERRAGTTKWSPRQKVKMAVDSFVQFSFAPIRFMTYIGIVIALLGFAYAVFLSVRRLVWAEPVLGWTSVIVVVLILGGIQLIMLGVLGEYLWRTADESRRRPVYIVRQVLGPASDRGHHASGQPDTHQVTR